MTQPPGALLTDLYQLTMLQGYFRTGMRETAVFEFFARRLPPARGFLMAAGLEQALAFLEDFRFAPAELDWLAAREGFDADFVDHLAALRFGGAVHAMPEGSVCFANEPILRVTAPIAEAQIVESRLINILHFQTLIASKAARMALVAPGKQLVDFGFRRAHGEAAGLYAARAGYLAGFTGSATVEAERLFGVPAYGTMAHSFVQAHRDETEAFLNFARACPGNVVLLIDTYDTEAGAEKVVALAPRLASEGVAIRAVRLDSGDLADHARKVRHILDAGGLAQVKIFASSGIDEYSLQELIGGGAPIDGYGIGTHLTTSADAPYLDCAYKIQEYAGEARRKRSEGKATWPGRKQVYRRYDEDGRMAGDVLTVEGDPQPGEALIQPVMAVGQRVQPPTPLADARQRAARALAHLPEHLRRLEHEPPYPVEVAPALRALAEAVDRRTEGRSRAADAAS